MKMIKYCVICGRRFETERNNKKTCSKSCCAERNRDTARKRRKHTLAKKKQKPKISELARIEQSAREYGLTYGRYVGMYEHR